MATASGLRIGDADRDAVVASLREHFAQGRLTLDEFQQRLGAVFSAKTGDDLARITSDLPHIITSAEPAGGLGGAGGRHQHGQRHQHGYRYQQGQRSRPSVLAGFVMIILALLVIALLLPTALFGMALSRSLLFVLAIVLFGRRGLLRWLRGRRRGPGRRWPF